MLTCGHKGLLTGATTSHRVVFSDLNFHPALGSELGHDNRVDNLLENGRLPFAPQAVIESMKVSSSDDIIKMYQLQCRIQ